MPLSIPLFFSTSPYTKPRRRNKTRDKAKRRLSFTVNEMILNEFNVEIVIARITPRIIMLIKVKLMLINFCFISCTSLLCMNETYFLEGKFMSIEEIGMLSYKTLICYVFLIVILKVMGKREIGKLSTFDLVCFFVISELFSLSLNEPKSSILHSIIPITIIVILQVLTALLSLKNRKFRKSMEGSPSFLIYNGKIDIKQMKKNRYNLDDLMLQLRTKDVQLPDEVQFGILESNGELNVILKNDNDFLDPLPIIEDGKINLKTLNRVGYSEEELINLINEQGYHDVKEIFLMLLKNDGAFILPYEKEN